MATGETQIPSLPAPLMAEVEKVARAQKRTVSQVLAEAVDRVFSASLRDCIERGW